VAPEAIVLDPGPDFAKTPAETLAVLRGLPRLGRLGRPLLLAASRKDFVGAVTGRPPRERLAGTLAAVGYGVDAGASIVRVHDVAATVDFLRVRAALAGDGAPPDALPEALRWEEPAA
jgi:dihydropteroate synthase